MRFDPPSAARIWDDAAMASSDYDVLVVGSGFGGSVTALRLTEKGYRVGVIEAGRRFDTETLPKTSWDLRRFLWAPKLGMRGIQRITPLKDIAILSGAGVGGGSLVYANTLYEPLEPFYTDKQWGHITDWKAELAPFYDQAKRMLGVNQVPADTPPDKYMQQLAERMGVEDTYHRTPVGVWFGKAGERVPDPYFGGEGPDKVGCTHCGSCMVGCRVGAKNTLDRNYLYLAEKNGAVVHPDTQVTDMEPVAGGGWRVTTERPGAWVRKRTKTITAEQVVLSAGVLGTVKLLLQLRDEGRLPALSDRLGDVVRTNSEAIVGATAVAGDHGGAAGEGLQHRQPERLGGTDREGDVAEGEPLSHLVASVQEAVEDDGGIAGQALELVDIGPGAVHVQLDRDAATMQFDGRRHPQLRTLLVRHPTDVAQLERLFAGAVRERFRGLVAHRVEGLQVDTQRYVPQLRAGVHELVGGVARGDHDGVELLGQSSIQGADHGLHAELGLEPHRQHVVESLVAEQRRADPPFACPLGGR